MAIGDLHGQSLRAQTAALQNLAQLPLAFEQYGNTFVARGHGYSVALRNGTAHLHLTDASKQDISLQFQHALATQPISGAQLPGKVNYILGNNSARWRLDLPTFSQVTFPEIYPGIDVVYYGNQHQLEFDLVVKPGGNPSDVRIKIGVAPESSTPELSINSAGALQIGGPRPIALASPEIYQVVDGFRTPVAGRYKLLSRDEVGFQIDPYDQNTPLVIDPTITYSALLGTGLGLIQANAIGLDPSGNILLAGTLTAAADFSTLNAAKSTFGGASDGFITKLNPAGTAILYSTFLGGSGADSLQGLAIDTTGAVWVTGNTTSTDFPVLNAAQSVNGGGTDAVVAKLNAQGVLQFSTYLGGTGADAGNAIALDASGNGYVAGSSSGAFPASAGVVGQVSSGGGDAFVAKYNLTGTRLFATLLGGSGADTGLAIAIDASGNSFVTGSSFSGSFTGAPTGGAQAVSGGSGDAFIAKLNANATALLYFTFLGGSGFEQGNAIVLDSLGNAYIGGQTSSAGLGTAGSFQSAIAGAADAFIAKLNSSGSALLFFTYLGGVRTDILTGMSADASGIYATGYTNSILFPTSSAPQASMPGNGIALFQSNDSGGSWAVFDSKIPGATFDLSIDPTASSVLAATDNGIFRTTNGGSLWAQQSTVAFASSSSNIFARSPVAPSTIYAGAPGGIYKSTDNGVTWNRTGSPPGSYSGILADPLTATTIYTFGSNYKSTDGGVTWTAASAGLPGLVLAMAATSDGSLYAGTFGQGVYKSSNQGASWSAVNNGIPSTATAFANSLSASGSTVYFAAGRVYKTTNGGASWSTVTSPATPANQVTAQSASTIYVTGAAAATQKSTDGGTTWSSAGSSLPSTVMSGIRRLVADLSNSSHLILAAPTNQAAFAAKLNSTGANLIWSTYLGGPASASAGYAIAGDGKGSVFVAGVAGTGQGFPLTSTALPTGSYNAFVTSISDATAACSISVNPGSQTVTAAGQTLVFSVVAPSNCAWTASTNQTWARVLSGASGNGAGTVEILVAANTNAASQSAVVTIGAQNINIMQSGTACSYSLDQTSYSAPSIGGSVSPTIITALGCPWALTNTYQGAVSVDSQSSGTGSATVSLTVTPNPSTSPRTFLLPVGTASISITQPAAGVSSTTTALTSSSDPSTAAQSIKLTAAVSPSAATGSVTFLDGSTVLGLAYLNSGVATYTISTLAAGAHALTAVYAGTTGFNGSTSPVLTQTVLTPPTQPWTQCPAVGLSPTCGVLVVFDASNGVSTFTASSPTVLPYDGNKDVLVGVQNNSTATITSLPLDGGSIPVFAFDGTGLCTAAPAAPNCPTSTGSTGFEGPGVSFSNTNAAGTLGTVNFNPGIAPGGHAYFGLLRASPASVLTVHPIVNSLNPSATAAAGAGFTLTINGLLYSAGATVNWKSPSGVPTILTPATISSTQITVAIPSTLLGVGGVAVITVSSAGLSSNPVNFIIGPTTTTLTSSLNPAPTGQPVTLTATVSPSTATGSVSFYDGATLLGTAALQSGTAMLATSALTAGSHSLSAVYNSDALDASSTGLLTQQMYVPFGVSASVLPGGVVGAPYTATLSAAGGTPPYTTWAIASGSLPPGLTLNAATGQIAGTPSTAVNSPFSFAATVHDSASNISPAQTLSIPITAATITLTSSVSPAALNQPITLSATILPATATGTVTFRDGTTTLGTGVISNGTASLTVSSLASGTHSVTAAFAGGVSAALSQVVTTVKFNSPPAVVSITPASSTGAAQTFTAVFTDPDGAADIQFVQMLVGVAPDGGGQRFCLVHFDRAGNAFYVFGDAGAFLGPVAPGVTSNLLQTSSCAVSALNSTVNAAGNTLTVTISLGFQAAFSGAKNLYLRAYDSAGHDTTPLLQGTYSIIPATLSSTNFTVAPSAGSGSGGAFTATFPDPTGFTGANPAWVQILFAASSSGAANFCLVHYDAGGNGLWLYGDSNYFLGPVAPGTDSPLLQNRACVINPLATTVTHVNGNLQINLVLGFKPSLAGTQNVYLHALDATGYDSGFQSAGTWTVTNASAIISLTPAASTGATQRLSAIYYHPSGAQALQWTQMLIAAAPDGGGQPFCYAHYDRNGNGMWLYSDSLNYFLGPITPGAASTALQSSACTIDTANSSESLTLSNYFLNWTMQFNAKAGFSGTKNVYLRTEDIFLQDTGATKMGTATMP